MTFAQAAVVLALLALAAAVAAAAAVVWLGRKSRDHRRHLDARLDELARALAARSAEVTAHADRRADLLGARLETQAELQRIDHLLDLIGTGERSGRLAADAARRLEVATLALRADARAATPAAAPDAAAQDGPDGRPP